MHEITNCILDSLPLELFKFSQRVKFVNFASLKITEFSNLAVVFQKFWFESQDQLKQGVRF